MSKHSLYGDFSKDGFELSRNTTAENFSGDLPAGALHIVLNLEGGAILFSQTLRISLTAGTLAVLHTAKNELISANRLPDSEADDYLILSVSTEWIAKTFGSKKESLHPDLFNILTQKHTSSTTLGKVRSMSLSEREIARELTSPPVPQAAVAFWYPAKVLEILTLHLFAPATLQNNEPFCSKFKRHEKTRVEVSIAWLKDRLDQPLDLTALADHIGCAPHYLSRQFKKVTGMTLKQKHRELRIDHAAKLLLDGDYNVTEAAMEVGYNSLSHFSKAFHEVKGQLPSEFAT